jgi:hypothetical protein
MNHQLPVTGSQGPPQVQGMGSSSTALRAAGAGSSGDCRPNTDMTGMTNMPGVSTAAVIGAWFDTEMASMLDVVAVPGATVSEHYQHSTSAGAIRTNSSTSSSTHTSTLSGGMGTSNSGFLSVNTSTAIAAALSVPAAADDISSVNSGSAFYGNMFSEARKDNDLKVFGPKFCQIFDAYQKVTRKAVDFNDHLFIMCCDNLIPFARWCRDDGKCFIRAVLADHNDLRCEVRNGLATVLVYTFSAMKAAMNKTFKSDMFKELSNPATGFNIAHKCSIKIYTDPCNYLSFLKQSLSGLISAGILPDNERVNQQSAIRRTVDSVEDTEELRMYNDLVILLGKYISRDLDLGKRCVEDVVKLWSSKSKVQ